MTTQLKKRIEEILQQFLGEALDAKEEWDASKYTDKLFALFNSEIERVIGRNEPLEDSSEMWEQVNNYRKNLYRHGMRSRNNLRNEQRNRLKK